ncbi:hypothetical protein [Pandoravirus japonicus]|uniref:Uncharacterized protein n=1 Tax=Pandoravirus japonicus TaxID=2823154 RepID=A0A811BQ64_9VIRU|nr:hypothetical protein [Pandoravirus japonicus]BCU03149.1 hypothetical protein [Pandoravirus japonicus]
MQPISGAMAWHFFFVASAACRERVGKKRCPVQATCSRLCREINRAPCSGAKWQRRHVFDMSDFYLFRFFLFAWVGRDRCRA